MATIARRGNSWRVQKRAKNLTTSKSFKTEQEALNYAALLDGMSDKLESEETQKELSEIATELTPEGLLDGPHKPASFREVLIKYQREVTIHKKTFKNETNLIKKILKEDWVDWRIDALTAGVFDQFKVRRLREVRPSSVRRYFDVIKHAMKTAKYQWGWDVPYDAVQFVTIKTEGKKITRRITKEQIEILRYTIEGSEAHYIGSVYELGLETALRRSEFTKLMWDDVDLDKQTAHIRDTKNGHDRTIVLTPRAVEILKEIEITDARVFPVSPDAITSAWKRLVKRAKLEGQVRFHDIRHTACSLLFEKGLTPIEVARISGHKSLHMVMHYSAAETESIISKFNGGDK